MIEWTTLGAIITPLTRRSPLQQGWSPQCEPQPAEDGAWGVLKTTAIQAGRFLEGANKRLPANLEPRPELEVLPGDLLMTCAGPRSRCGVPTLVRGARPRLMLSGKMYRFRTIDDVDPRFLELYLLSDEAQRLIDGMKTGISESGLNLTKGRFMSLPVPIAPMKEQRQIIEILDVHLSRLDEGAALLDRCQHQLAALDEAAIVEALGLGADTGRIVGGDLPGLPAGWRWSTLADVADVVGGVTKDAKKQADPAFVEVPYLRVANVQRARLDLSNVTSIRVPRAKADALALRPGDVLMNEGGDRDKLARGWIWEGQIDGCIHQNHVFRARPLGDVRSEWLAWCANSYGSRWAQRHGKQSVNLASISLRTIRTMPIPIPSLDVQDERLNTLRNAVERNSRLRAQIALSRVRAQALRRSLLAAAFAGRLAGSKSAVDAQMTRLANPRELAPA